MDISKYTKAIAAGATGLLGIISSTVTLTAILPPQYHWVAATAAGLTTASTVIGTGLVWLAKNETGIQADVNAGAAVADEAKKVYHEFADHGFEPLKAGAEALWKHPAELTADAEHIYGEVKGLPAQVKKFVAEAKSAPVLAVGDAVAVARTAVSAADDAVTTVVSAPVAVVPAAPVVAAPVAEVVHVAPAETPAPAVAATATPTVAATSTNAPTIAEVATEASAIIQDVKTVASVVAPAVTSVEDFLKAHPIL